MPRSQQILLHVTQLIAAVLNAHFTDNVLTNLKYTYSTQMRVTLIPYHVFRHIIAVLITPVMKSIVFLLILSQDLGIEERIILKWIFLVMRYDCIVV